jgi:hypothetical protein
MARKEKSCRNLYNNGGNSFATRWCGVFSGFSKKVVIEF